jgi:hypothetical protein
MAKGKWEVKEGKDVEEGNDKRRRSKYARK